MLNRIHGFIDYCIVAILLLAPLVMEFNTSEALFSITVAVVLLIYSIITRYRRSVLKIIPYWLHLALDTALALILLFAPYLLRLPDAHHSALFMAVGILQLFVVIFSVRY